MVRWWWTGLDVDENELLKEVQELDNAGFLGAEIQVFMIGSPFDLEKTDIERAKRSHRYMQPYYYQMVKSVLDEAEKRDMIIDLTISSSWPVGGTHIKKTDSMKTLMIGQKTIEGPLNYSGKIPEVVEPPSQALSAIEDFSKDRKLVAVTAAKPLESPGKIRFRKIKRTYLDIESLIDLTDKVNKDHILNWKVPQGTWQIFSFFSRHSGISPLADCKSDVNKTSLVIDHLASKPIKYHLKSHLGEAKKYFGHHFGKTLRAFFTDSLELASDWLWTDGFLSEFKRRRGYVLEPYLPICFVPSRDNKYRQGMYEMIPGFDLNEKIGDKIRYDYELTISDLFCENYVQTMTEWAEKNNLRNRIQGYGIRADTLKIFGISHIPETEQLFAGGINDFLKLASSAGIIYNKQIITAESIVWNQRDYMTTPLKWKVAADKLFSSGVNQMIYHGYPYQNPHFPYPGFCGFSTPYLPSSKNYSSNFSRNNPFWEFFPILNQYISRCQYILQLGKVVSNIALFYPLFDYCDDILKREELVGGYLDEYDAKIAKGAFNAHVKESDKLNYNEQWTSSFLRLTDDLTSNGYYYMHVNEEAILNSKVVQNKLIIGSAEVEILIIPNLKTISLAMAKKLKEISNNGIPILFTNSIPLKQPSFLNYEKNDVEISNIMKDLHDNNKIFLSNDVEEISELILERFGVKPRIKFEKPEDSIYYIHKQSDIHDFYFLRNSQNSAKRVKFKFFHPTKIPFILNSWSGNIIQAPQYRRDEEYVEMDLFFHPYEALLIDFKEDSEDPYVTESELKIERQKSNLISYIDTPGNYTIKLNTGDEKSINIGENDLYSIKIENFRFETYLRDYLGNYQKFTTEMQELKDWRTIPELKFCSNKAVYSFNFDITKEHLQEENRVIISIGRIHDAGIIEVNGEEFPPLLTYPYIQDITSSVKIGKNEVQIEITPTLRNRLIGYGKTGGKDWINHKYKKELMPSGLIGPILVKIVRKFIIK
jgi:hypothetical protein